MKKKKWVIPIHRQKPNIRQEIARPSIKRRVYFMHRQISDKYQIIT